MITVVNSPRFSSNIYFWFYSFIKVRLANFLCSIIANLCTLYVFQHFNFKAEWYLSLMLTKHRNSFVNLAYRANSALQCDFRLVADKCI